MADAGALNRTKTVRYPDIGAKIVVGAPPRGLADELPGLYGSLFSTEPWFRLCDEVAAEGACVLENPRHVLLYWCDGDTVEVLNKAFHIAPPDAARACRALFRALPGARRIHLEVMFPPAALPLPKRVLYSAEDMVVDLPPSAEEYYASLGRRTRKNVRNLENRLRRAHPDAATAVAAAEDQAPELFKHFLAWHLARAERRGIVSGYVSKPRQVAQIAALVQELADVHQTAIGGRLAAVEFVFRVGPDATLFAGSYDSAYDDLSLGFLSTYWAIRDAAARGAQRCHLLWGDDYYKSLLGARPETATRLSVFRSKAARLHSAGEAREVAWRRIRRRSHHLYWRLRGAVGRRLRTVRQRRPSLNSRDDSTSGETRT